MNTHPDKLTNRVFILGKPDPELDPLLEHLNLVAKRWPLDSRSDLPAALLQRLQQPSILILFLSNDARTHWIQQALSQQPHSKIIACLGQAAGQLPCELIGSGVFDCLSLPMDFTSLQQAIQRAQLFLDSELQLQHQGQTRLQLTVQLHEGPREAAAAAEELLLRRSLAACHYNITSTARLLGLARSHLYYYLNKYGIQRPPHYATITTAGKPCEKHPRPARNSAVHAESRQVF